MLKIWEVRLNREFDKSNPMDVRRMNNHQVQKFIDDLSHKIDSTFWKSKEPFPEYYPLKINTILTYNNAFKHYVFSHRDKITGFQLESVMSMLRCSTNECGGITYSCPDCGEIKFIPFRCHSRVCPDCGKRYSEKWGRKLMQRFFQRITGM